MRRIVKRLFKRDTTGKIHQESIQELVDNECGTITETTLTTLTTCATCSRPVEKLTEMRGCDRCGASCCDHCATACAVCDRNLCPHCRRGFGERQLAVCPECLSVLNERLERSDRLLEEKTSFERQLAVYREQARIVQYGMFHNYPCGDLLEQLAEIHLMRRLNSLERGITDHAERE